MTRCGPRDTWPWRVSLDRGGRGGPVHTADTRRCGCPGWPCRPAVRWCRTQGRNGTGCGVPSDMSAGRGVSGLAAAARVSHSAGSGVAGSRSRPDTIASRCFGQHRHRHVFEVADPGIALQLAVQRAGQQLDHGDEPQPGTLLLRAQPPRLAIGQGQPPALLVTSTRFSRRVVKPQYPTIISAVQPVVTQPVAERMQIVVGGDLDSDQAEEAFWRALPVAAFPATPSAAGGGRPPGSPRGTWSPCCRRGDTTPRGGLLTGAALIGADTAGSPSRPDRGPRCWARTPSPMRPECARRGHSGWGTGGSDDPERWSVRPGMVYASSLAKRSCRRGSFARCGTASGHQRSSLVRVLFRRF